MRWQSLSQRVQEGMALVRNYCLTCLKNNSTFDFGGWLDPWGWKIYH